MELAFSTNAFTRHSLDAAIKAIAGCGYTGVEILADKPHWYPEAFSAPVAARVRKLLDKTGLHVSNINANCTFGYWKNPPPEPFFEPSLISPKLQLRRDRMRMIKNTLRFAQAIGAGNISITSGKVLPTMEPEKAWPLLRDSLRTLLDDAEKLGVRIGIECEPMLFIEYAQELRTLIGEIGSDFLGANLDIGHSVVLGEDIGEVLAILRGRIWNCHIEDIPNRKHYHLIPGQGSIDWFSLKAALEGIGYQRSLTVELYTYPDRPAHAAQESLRFLRGVFGD